MLEPIEQIQQLARSYSKSKVKRVAAVYNDVSPIHRHLVHQWFNVQPHVPKKYYNYIRKK